jgi:transcriptional regulator with XRE-family HTH domain
LKLTQEALEAISGIPQGTISRIEREEVEDIHVSTLVGLAEALDMSPNDMLGVKTKPVTKPTAKTAAPQRARTPARAAKG